jgi:uncharacterized protein
MNKLSRYNHFYRWQDGYYIAYNARTGAVALMTDENYHSYQQLAAKMNGDTASLTPPEQELLKQLQYGLFVYDDERDEFGAVKFQHELVKYDRTRLGLVIAPTLACNMACKYCYEANKKGKMSTEVIEDIISFVDKQAKSLEQVDINWYGGEPLLALDVIEDLSLTLMDLGKDKHFIYTSSIITNGYLLSKEVVDKLVGLNVTVCQVTVDGPARLHNEKRPLKNGKDSYQTIVENLKYASTKMIVTIRVNVDKSFDDAVITELLEELKQAGLRERVSLYFGQLEPASSACAAIAETCFDAADFSGVEIDYYRLLLDHGFRIEKLPSPVSTFCMAHQVGAFLIDPEGYLYRCWNHVGDVTKSTGLVSNAVDYQNPNFMRYFGFNPFEDEVCKQCDILPICVGGCPSQRIDRKMTGEQMCQSWKHNLAPMLEIIARSRQQRTQAVSKE